MEHHCVQVQGALNTVYAHYGDECAKRSGIPKINHISEGLRLLDYLEVHRPAKVAFCLHPIVQDGCGRDQWSQLYYTYGERVMYLLHNYTAVANKFLPAAVVHRTRTGFKTIPIELPEDLDGDVRWMLLADKIQNRKDYRANWNKFPNWIQLADYFNAWMIALDLSDDEIDQLTRELTP